MTYVCLCQCSTNCQEFLLKLIFQWMSFYAIALLTSAVQSLSNCFVVFVGYVYIFAGLSQKIGYSDSMYWKQNRLFSVSSFRNSTVIEHLLISSQLENLSLYDYLLFYYLVMETYSIKNFLSRILFVYFQTQSS